MDKTFGQRQAQEMNLTDQEWQTLVKGLKRLRR